MNQKQREFLLDQVKKIYQGESSRHDKHKPDEPNLSNYLVAAILAGEAKMKSIDSLQKKMRERVIKLGKKDAFLTGDSYHRYGDDDEGNCIVLPALDLFEEPSAYTKERLRYEAEYAEWKEKQAALNELHRSLEIKIQIGSDATLDALISEADNLGNLSLVNARLTIKPTNPMLGEKEKTKEIGIGKKQKLRL